MNSQKQKAMGHFIDWKFGVPVKVFAKNQADQDVIRGEGRLTRESSGSFSVYWAAGGHINLLKTKFYYKLIPHKAGVVTGPRYPVCQSTFNAAYCNADEAGMTKLSTHYEQLEPASVATLNIDGKTIELSAETTAELKKKLGM